MDETRHLQTELLVLHCAKLKFLAIHLPSLTIHFDLLKLHRATIYDQVSCIEPTGTESRSRRPRFRSQVQRREVKCITFSLWANAWYVIRGLFREPCVERLGEGALTGSGRYIIWRICRASKTNHSTSRSMLKQIVWDTMMCLLLGMNLHLLSQAERYLSKVSMVVVGHLQLTVHIHMNYIHGA